MAAWHRNKQRWVPCFPNRNTWDTRSTSRPESTSRIKKSHYVDKSEWQIFKNTQEPIIDQETFDNVQRIRARVKRYPDGWGEAHPLTGILYCADCGHTLYVHRVNNGKRELSLMKRKKSGRQVNSSSLSIDMQASRYLPL